MSHQNRIVLKLAKLIVQTKTPALMRVFFLGGDADGWVEENKKRLEEIETLEH